jgi:hypothetical protein
MLFSDLINEFRESINYNRKAFNTILKQSPNGAYKKVNELSLFVGKRYSLKLQLHFPDPSKIANIDLYGLENIGIVVDKFRKTFPIHKQDIKLKAIEIFGSDVYTQDAYIYDGKEGVRINYGNGRIDVLPGSLLLWCVIDEKVKNYGDWLMQNVYFPTLTPPKNNDTTLST